MSQDIRFGSVPTESATTNLPPSMAPIDPQLASPPLPPGQRLKNLIQSPAVEAVLDTSKTGIGRIDITFLPPTGSTRLDFYRLIVPPLEGTLDPNRQYLNKEGKVSASNPVDMEDIALNHVSNALSIITKAMQMGAQLPQYTQESKPLPLFCIERLKAAQDYLSKNPRRTVEGQSPKRDQSILEKVLQFAVDKQSDPYTYHSWLPEGFMYRAITQAFIGSRDDQYTKEEVNFMYLQLRRAAVKKGEIVQ